MIQHVVYMELCLTLNKMQGSMSKSMSLLTLTFNHEDRVSPQ